MRAPKTLGCMATRSNGEVSTWMVREDLTCSHNMDRTITKTRPKTQSSRFLSSIDSALLTVIPLFVS